jgi:tetratricopeptide (TPR) repeat protein
VPIRLQAQEHLRLGNAAFLSGRVGEAIAEYETAAQLFPSPGIFYNLGQAYEAGERPQDALRAYETFIAGSAKPPADLTNAALIADLHRRVEDARERVTVLRSALIPKGVSLQPVATALVAPQSQGTVAKPLTLAASDPSRAPEASRSADLGPLPAKASRKAWWLVGIGAVVVVGAVTALLIVHPWRQSCNESYSLGCIKVN